MKKIILGSLLFSAACFVLTSCLKDKGFENFQYGINDPDTQPPGVGFPLGSKPKNDFGLDVTGSTQVVDGFVYVNLESGVPASSDVTITIANNTTALLNAYNTANGTAILALPTAVWNVVTTLVIPSGGRNVQVPLNVTNTLALNPNLQYAVGLTITNVTGGYKIATNLDDLFIVFGVKNQYDGKYTLRGQFYHPSASPDYAWYTTPVQMWTTGPNSVKMWTPIFGGNGFYHPWSSGGSLTAFGSQEPEYTVNPATNAVTVFNSFVPAATIYSMGIGYTNAGYSSRWDPALKTMYACFGYNLGAGGTFSPASARMWIDTLIRTGPR
jgi:Domain of unknown function (DUF1735)